MTLPTRKKGPVDVADSNDLSRALGAVEGKLDMVIASLARIDTDGSVSRAAVRADVAELKDRLVEIEAAVEDMRPIVKRVAEARLMGKGFVAGVAFVAGVTGSGVAVFINSIFGGS